MATVAKSQTHPLLAKYLVQLAAHPLRTKAFTAATLSFLQEILGSNFAGLPVKSPSPDMPFIFHVLARSHIDLKALKMAVYGFCISAPMSHYLVGALQKAFAGKTSLGARIAQLLASNLLVAPIQTAVYLSSMAVINGAKSYEEVIKTVRAGFLSVIRITWIMSPVLMTTAQKFIPVELWVPFFNAAQFILGTYFNTRVKQMKLAAIKKERDARDRANRGD